MVESEQQAASSEQRAASSAWRAAGSRGAAHGWQWGSGTNGRPSAVFACRVAEWLQRRALHGAIGSGHPGCCHLFAQTLSRQTLARP